MRKGNKWGKIRCISSYLGTADLCRGLPFHSFFNTWGSLASELNMHKANQFILSFPYGSQKEQDIPLYSSTVGSLPLFRGFFWFFFFLFFLSLLWQGGKCFWRVLYLSWAGLLVPWQRTSPVERGQDTWGQGQCTCCTHGRVPSGILDPERVGALTTASFPR